MVWKVVAPFMVRGVPVTVLFTVTVTPLLVVMFPAASLALAVRV
jgi:hypothetical protein